MKTSTSLLAVLALGAAVGLAWWWQRPAPQGVEVGAQAARAAGAAAAAVTVESTLVRVVPLREDVEAVGSLRSRQGVVVRAEASGRVAQVGFRDGQAVRRGQLLVQLDDRLPRAQVQQADAELGIAESKHRRNTELVNRGFISRQALDESGAAVQVARARAELARATAARLRVLAPFDGVAGLRQVNVGDYLREGDEVLGVQDMAAMHVDFRLPERLQARVRQGQPVRVQVQALPGQAFAAVVQAVDPLIDADGRALSVRGCIDNRAGHLRPGMFARVNTRLGDDRQALVVPEEAIVSQGGSQSVVRLQPQAEGAWLAQRVAVQTGVRQAGMVEVVQGLANGDRVVTAGHQRIQRDGVPVRLADVAGDGAATPSGAALAPGDAPPTPVSDELPLVAAPPGVNPCGAVAAH
ncbi:MAG: efflux RND transporter periplasmic adaptor subunit [Pseudomonadota bacterium]|nr:efflux RND transporter periplasmic adaptor subunit [Pseudomonadota bacterium]